MDEFWSCTPHEFVLAVKAKTDSREAERYIVAWHASLMLNCWSKKGQKASPEKLLGISKKGQVKSLDQMREIQEGLKSGADAKDEKLRSSRKFGDPR